VPLRTRLIELSHATTDANTNTVILNRVYHRLIVGAEIAVISSTKRPQLAYTVVRSSVDGRQLSDIQIHDGEEVLDIAESTGKLWILSTPISGDPGVWLGRVNVGSSELSDVTPVDQAIYRLLSLKSGLFGITRSGTITCIQPATSGALSAAVTVPLGNPDSTLFVAMAEDTIAAVDRVEARVAVVNAVTGATNTWSIDSPDVATVKERYRKEGANMANPKVRIAAFRGHTILAATGGQGLLFVMLSGFRAEEGAPILKLDMTGRITGAFRIPMVNGGTAFIPEDMAFHSGELYILAAQGQVVSYNIK
jgi:hypothetical protein